MLYLWWTLVVSWLGLKGLDDFFGENFQNLTHEEASQGRQNSLITVHQNWNSCLGKIYLEAETQFKKKILK